MKVLAIETVESTRMIKHGKILKAVFRSRRTGKSWITASRAAGADKVPHAVGRERIMVGV
jgi:hypothetical protein